MNKMYSRRYCNQQEERPWYNDTTTKRDCEGNINDYSILKRHYDDIRRHHENNSKMMTPKRFLPKIEPVINYAYSPLQRESSFTNNNQRYLNNYKRYIDSKSHSIDNNAKQYIDYMTKELNECSKSGRYSPMFSKYINENFEPISSNQIAQEEKEDSYSLVNDKRHSRNFFNPGLLKSHHSDINNPFYFLNESDNSSYVKLKEKQRQIMLYNKDIINQNRRRRFQTNTERDSNIIPNPYAFHSTADLGRSQLVHNTILNPISYVAHNRYFMK